MQYLCINTCEQIILGEHMKNLVLETQKARFYRAAAVLLESITIVFYLSILVYGIAQVISWI